MSWAMIDDKILSHPKMLRAEAIEGDAAWTLWTKALVFVRLHQLDGIVPGDMLPNFVRHKSPAKIAATLVRVGLWHAQGDDFRIHGYHDINDTKEQVDLRKQEARERMAKRRGVRANKSEQLANICEQSKPVRESSEGVQTPEPYQPEPTRTNPNQVEAGRAAPSPAPTPGLDKDSILAMLAYRPALRPIATEAHASTLAGRLMSGPKPPAHVALALDDLARDAQAADDSSETWRASLMATKAATYIANAQGPRLAPVSGGGSYPGKGRPPEAPSQASQMAFVRAPRSAP